jgi:hypothetical protein
MNRTNLIFAIIIILALSFTACSKKGADKIIGKWKADKIEEMEKAGIRFELTYEFTKDKIILEQTINGQLQPKAEAVYTIKSDDGNNILLEATHQESQAKGEFKIKLEDNRMTLIDPDNMTLKLTKM